MSEREQLMRQFSSAGFAAWELHLYLNTHPYDREMFEKMKKYQAQSAKLRSEYESKYGPLTIAAVDDIRDGWTRDPWPWEKEDNE